MLEVAAAMEFSKPTPTRTYAKKTPSPEEYRGKAIKRYFMLGNDKRNGFIQQYRNASTSAQRNDTVNEVISELFGGNIDGKLINFNEDSPEEDFGEYWKLYEQIEQAINDELNAEQAQNDLTLAEINEAILLEEELREDEAVLEDTEDSGNDNTLLCPSCWVNMMVYDDSSNLLFCNCGIIISLVNHNSGKQITVNELKQILGELYDRHYVYCQPLHNSHVASHENSFDSNASHNSQQMIISPTPPKVINNYRLTFTVYSGSLVASCPLCGFCEEVLQAGGP